MFFHNALTFSIIQQMLAIWSLVPLPFLNPAWRSGSSWFMYCWSLAYIIFRIICSNFSITLLACESRSVMSNSLRPHGLYHARFPCPSPSLRVCSNSRPLSRWCHSTVSSPSPPAFNLSQHQGLFQWVSSSHQVAKVLEFQLQHQSFQWIVRTDFL